MEQSHTIKFLDGDTKNEAHIFVGYSEHGLSLGLDNKETDMEVLMSQEVAKELLEVLKKIVDMI